MRRALLGLCVSISVASLSVTGGCASSTSGPGAASQYNYRSLPQKSLRGELVVVATPDIRVNGRTARLAPGSRIRSENNAIVMATTLTNQRLIVNYTVDLAGQLQDVWILNPAERETVWPRTAEEAQRWEFDVNRQTWTPK